MRGALRQMFGQATVVMGLSFAQGTFNAVGLSGSTYTTLGPHTVAGPKYDSYEEYFLGGGMPGFFLDLRSRSAMPDTPSWLPGPRNALSIGPVHADATPDAYCHLARLPDEYDVIIFFDWTTASDLLPFKYPQSY